MDSTTAGNTVTSTDVSASQGAPSDIPTSARPPQEPPKNPFAGTKHKVKIDSQEIEVPYEQLISDYQMGKASRKKFEEAAAKERNVTEFIEGLSKGELDFLKKHIPPDKLRQFAEQQLQEYVDFESLTKEQKEKIVAERERDEARKELEEERREKLEAYNARIEQQAAEELDNEIAQAIRDLKADQGLNPDEPVDAWFVTHIAKVLEAHYESLDDDDVTDFKMTAKDAASHAWKGVEKTVVNYLSTISTEKVIALLPRELRDAIRKADFGEVVTKLHDKQKTAPDRIADGGPQAQVKEDRFSRLDKQFARRG